MITAVCNVFENALVLYIDGQQDNANAFGTDFGDLSNTADFKIGNDGTGSLYSGDMDCPAFTAHVLTASEVSDIYAVGQDRP